MIPQVGAILRDEATELTDGERKEIKAKLDELNAAV